MTFDFLDLFSGAGLFSAGLVQAGMRPVLAVDASSAAVASYRANVAPCAVRGDVRKPKDVPAVDVVIAGPPCQGFSTLGRRDPGDPRNELGVAILPWIEAAAPKVVVVENVPAFLDAPQWREMVDGLKRLGYDRVHPWVLDAEAYGTPQRRKRAFTVASRIGAVPPPFVMWVPVPAGRAMAWPPIPADDPMHVWPVKEGVVAERIAVVPPRGGRRDIVRLRPDLCPPSWSTLGNDTTDVYGRIDPDQPAATLRCEFQNPSKGRYLHPTEDRVISLREGMRLQGIPDDWNMVGRPWTVARQIGNGVPVPLAKAVGVAVREALVREARHAA